MKQTTCTYISVIMLTLFASSFVRIYQKLWELSGFPPWLNFCGHPVHVSYSINISGIPVRQLVPVYRTFLMTYRYEYRTCIPVSIPTLYPLLSLCRCVRLHRVFFAYKSWTDGWILMILTYIIDIDETVKLTQGQGHKVKGQGHICIYVKFLFRL